MSNRIYAAQCPAEGGISNACSLDRLLNKSNEAVGIVACCGTNARSVGIWLAVFAVERRHAVIAYGGIVLSSSSDRSVPGFLMSFCAKCFHQPGLQQRLAELEADSDDACDFHHDLRGVDVDAVVAIIEPVFRYYYGCHAVEMDGDPLEMTIAELVDADTDEIAEALAEALCDLEGYSDSSDDPFFDTSLSYSRIDHPDDHSHTLAWDRFCEGLLHSRRFFNPAAKATLDDLFSGIECQLDDVGQRPVYALAPGSVIYRARQALSDGECRRICSDPTRELAAPPPRERRAGRMNAPGIIAFYGALDVDTCLTEIRPAVGRTVVHAAFSVVRPIWVLDFRRFGRPVMQTDPFAEGHVAKITQWQFLSQFLNEIRKPIVPEDEMLDYIPTQAVAEYLSGYVLRGAAPPNKIEGLIFPSAQCGGANIVLMQHAAKVRPTPVSTPDDGFSLPEFPEANYGLELIGGSVVSGRVRDARYSV